MAYRPLTTGWRTIVSPEGKPGTADFPIDIKYADTYRVLARAKSPKGDVVLKVSIDGRRVGDLPIKQSEIYNWVELRPIGDGSLPKLDPGKH